MALPDIPALQEMAHQQYGEVMTQLETTANGLSDAEALSRLQRYGPNQLLPGAKRSELALFAAHLKNPLILILLVATAIAYSLGETVNATIIAFIVLLSIVIDYWQERDARKAVETLKNRISSKVTTLRNGLEQELDPSQLCPGDIIILNAGKIVPADARVIFSRDCFANQSTLTGESYPAEKTSDPVADAGDLASLTNIVFAGTSITGGAAHAVVVITGTRTEFGKIASKLSQKPEITDFSHGLQQFGYMVMKITVILLLFTTLVNIAAKRPLLDSFMFALAVAVGLTPELLPVIMSVTMSKGALRIAKKGVIVKHIAAIPNFGSMEILCTDKTGTITEDKITMIKCLDTEGKESAQLFLLTYLNSFYQTGIGNPLDDAVIAYGKPDISAYRKVDEIPFDFYRKRMSIITSRGDDVLLICKGAPEEVFKACLPAYNTDAMLKQYEALSKDGFRVLAIATRKIARGSAYTKNDESGLQLEGFVAFMDPPKEDVAAVISGLTEMGVEIKIITGDNALVTQMVCKKIGLPIKGIMNGEELAQIPDEALQQRVIDTTIFARFSPDQKNRIIHALKARHKAVGYMGDGINDAPSLITADIGITVSTATDVAKEAADIILTQKELLVLKEGIVEGRKTFGNTMKYILMDLSSNFGNMFSVAAATLILPFLPMLPVQILINNFLYDTSQIAIPYDQVDESYTLKPQRWDMRMIRNFMLLYGLLSSVFDLVAFYLLLHYFRATPAQFRTGWFMESLATQILVIFIIRTNHLPFIQSKPSMQLTIAALLCLAAGWLLPYLPFSGAMGFEPLPLHMVAYIILVVIAYLICAQLLKYIIHKNQRLYPRH